MHSRVLGDFRRLGPTAWIDVGKGCSRHQSLPVSEVKQTPVLEYDWRRTR